MSLKVCLHLESTRVPKKIKPLWNMSSISPQYLAYISFVNISINSPIAHIHHSLESFVRISAIRLEQRQDIMLSKLWINPSIRENNLDLFTKFLDYIKFPESFRFQFYTYIIDPCILNMIYCETWQGECNSDDAKWWQNLEPHP